MDTQIEFKNQFDDMDERLKSSKKRFDTKINAQMLVPAVSILASVWGPYLLKITKILHSVKGKDAEQIEVEIDKLQDELSDVQISVRDGHMTVKEASQKANKIFLKMRILGKKVRNMHKKQHHESSNTNESVNSNAKTYDELLELVLEAGGGQNRVPTT